MAETQQGGSLRTRGHGPDYTAGRKLDKQISVYRITRENPQKNLPRIAPGQISGGSFLPGVAVQLLGLMQAAAQRVKTYPDKNTIPLVNHCPSKTRCSTEIFYGGL